MDSQKRISDNSVKYGRGSSQITFVDFSHASSDRLVFKVDGESLVRSIFDQENPVLPLISRGVQRRKQSIEMHDPAVSEAEMSAVEAMLSCSKKPKLPTCDLDGVPA